MDAAAFARWCPQTAAAYSFDSWARSHGLLVIDENRQPGIATLHTGDIVTYDFSHVGIIDTDTESGSILHTIEGNTDVAGGGAGNLT